MNPRRLDVEAYRDCMLAATGSLDDRLAGPSSDLDQPGNYRRTVYGRISRGGQSQLLQRYDFPEAAMHSPGREATATPPQQLFVKKRAFGEDGAHTLPASVEAGKTGNTKVRG